MAQYTSPSSTTPEPPSITLPDGRKLSYFTFGVTPTPTVPSPPTILYLHSTPSSGLEASHLHPLALSLSLRIIAPNRPGLSTSTPHPTSTLPTTISDLSNLISLISLLHLPPLALLAAHSGAPFALGLATALPQSHIRGLAVLSGTYPPSPASGQRGTHWTPWLVKNLSYYAPALVLSAFDAQLGRLARDTERPELFQEAVLRHMASRPASDLVAMRDGDIKAAVVEGAREGVRFGSGGAMREAMLLGMEWGFRVEDVRLVGRVWLCHGREDGETSVAMAEGVKGRIEGAVLEVVEGEAGIGVVLKRREVALGKLKAWLEEG
ncbi:Alpha/Beta hydrolase protein [Elsinoe ampelina]|uniref:Alpha/Beta hydrolase protein n=1 Tax=Elsinoe ampelina TaxID=302913 RepID=A0A6A6G5M7_9PEZI|nr:Alpha/Beta hydrolase protein [Elsinoe ampelina]